MQLAKFLLSGVDFFFGGIPVAFSFYLKANFFKSGAFYGPGFFSASLFIVWDMAFTKMGVCSTKIRLLGLYIFPLKRSCFRHHFHIHVCFCMKHWTIWLSKITGRAHAPSISIILVMFLFTLGLMNTDRWYTGVTFIACATLLHSCNGNGKPVHGAVLPGLSIYVGSVLYRERHSYQQHNTRACGLV